MNSELDTSCKLAPAGEYSAGDLTKDEAVREIRNLQTELRDNILKGNVKIKTTDCGGSRTLA